MSIISDNYSGYSVIRSSDSDPGIQPVRFRGIFKDASTVRAAASAAYDTLSRRKGLSAAAAAGATSRLARCLTALDLTALGVGSTLGVGVYVLAGNVSKYHAGPAVIISFLIAAVASIFAGLCYAEFGARVPKAGSAYVYSYVCVGEFIAFIIGWNLILEYVIGSASVVKGLSQYLDAMLNNTMATHLRAAMPMQMSYMAEYPDFFAFTITMVFTVALAFGAKESSRFNNIFTFVNLTVVIFVIISGSMKADTKNWRLTSEDAPNQDIGTGGFAPYGISGIIKGAAVCFYGFIGFDCVATAGEEARDPQKSIPIAVVASLLIIFLAYFGVSSVLTLMLPYYLQDENAPFPFVYEQLGWHTAKYVVSVGAICGLCSSLLGAMFPLPRIIYAMASDGLMFQFMGKVNERFQTPLIGTLLAGLFTGTLAAIFKLEQLINMMSIGTLLAYSMVASCVLLLRYEDSVTAASDTTRADKRWLRQLLNSNEIATPTTYTSKVVTLLVTFYGAWCFVVAWSVESVAADLLTGSWQPWCVLVCAVVPAVAALYFIHRQPVSPNKLSFTVPFVPWLPGLSILINVYLMINLDLMTWIRFGVWIVTGLFIYFGYGIWHSVERKRYRSKDIQSINGTAATTPVPLHTIYTSAIYEEEESQPGLAVTDDKKS